MRARSATSSPHQQNTQAGRQPSTSPSRPVGEGYSSDEVKPRSDRSSSPVGPVGEYSDSEVAEDHGPASPTPGADAASGASSGRLTPSRNGDRCSSSPIGPVGEGSSSSLIGPVGEGWTSDEQSSPSSGAVGEGPNGFQDGFPSMTQPSQQPPAPPTTPELNAIHPPTPIPAPDLLAPSGSAGTNNSGYRNPSPADDLTTAKSTIDWFEGELRLLKKAADVLSQTPAARISSRTEFWVPYNRLLGERGVYYQQLWLDNTYEVERV